MSLPPQGFSHFLFQFYQFIVLLGLVVGAFVIYLVVTRSPKKSDKESATDGQKEQQKTEAALKKAVSLDQPVTMVRNRSETILVPKQLQEELAEKLKQNRDIERKENEVKMQLSDSEEEEEEEEEEEVIEPTPRRRRIIGEVTVQKMVYPPQAQYSDSQLQAARELICKTIEHKVHTEH